MLSDSTTQSEPEKSSSFKSMLKSMFKSKKTENELKLDRDSFVKTFTDGNLFTEFKEFADDDYASHYLKFCESFSRLEQLVAEYASETSKKKKDPAEKDASETFQSMGRFIAGSHVLDKSHSQKALELPIWLVPHFLIFYASYLAPGAPHNVVISESARSKIISDLEAGHLHKIKSNVFDDAADEILIALYTCWFPRFLAYKYGNELPVLNKNLIPQQNIKFSSAGMSRSSSKNSVDSAEPRKSSDSGGRKIFGRRKSISSGMNEGLKLINELVYTKECMGKTLYEPTLYKEFEACIEADHCKENLLFFESFSKLENLLVENIPEYANDGTANSNYAKFITRFINEEKLETLPREEIRVPPQLYSHLLMFHASFICPGSPHEVNITDKLRRKIAEALAANGGKDVTANLFDMAAKEVMELLYLNTFKKFVKERKINGGIPKVPEVPSKLKK
ncbi:hypothetical protein HDU92_008548 [Lobulomyces angularis]|nr:hypothetical protein HDU92_008548 [Lobulomyces angularis]